MRGGRYGVNNVQGSWRSRNGNVRYEKMSQICRGSVVGTEGRIRRGAGGGYCKLSGAYFLPIV